MSEEKEPRKEELIVEHEVIRLDPNVVRQNLLEKLSLDLEQYSPRHRQESESASLLSWLEEDPDAAAALLHELTKIYRSPFGAMVPPDAADVEFKNRLQQCCHLLMVMLYNARREAESELERFLEKKRVSPEEARQVARKFKELIRLSIVSCIALSEVSHRLLRLIALNAPADARPALANILVGYDLMRRREVS